MLILTTLLIWTYMIIERTNVIETRTCVKNVSFSNSNCKKLIFTISKDNFSLKILEKGHGKY